MQVDYYNVLQVSHFAEKEVIEAAYRTLAKKLNNEPAKMKAINAAKEVLLDDKKRKDFDKSLTTAGKKVIGNYELIRQIAEGGFGKTYEGRHLTLGTHVCLKHANNISPEDEEICLNEAKSIWDLRHFSIPAMRDVIRHDDGSLLLVMSYVPGPTLAQIIEKNNGGIDPEHVSWITERVLNVLKYLHFHGIVHGDVKPQNIIVQPESHTVVLVDYGLSLIRPKKGSSNNGYTPFFAPPEQIAGKTLIPESDFYGLGMTMIYALGGDVQYKRVPSHVPDALCNFVKQLIPIDPLSRPNWDEKKGKKDLMEHFQDVREESFGRKYSNMKPLKVS